MKYLLAFLTLAACSAAGQNQETFELAPVADVVLSPSEEALPYALQAAERWAAATGLTIAVGPGGTPINLADSVSAMAGYAVCANTESGSNGPVTMTVDRSPPSGKCRELADTIAHEVGHVICRTFSPMTEEGECHTNAGLMKSGVEDLERDRFINTESLEAVCAVTPCSAFITETQN